MAPRFPVAVALLLAPIAPAAAAPVAGQPGAEEPPASAGQPGAEEPPAGPEALPPIVPPRLLEAPAIPFPPDAPDEPVEVGLRLLIDEAGRVTRAEPLAGPEPFLGLALEAAPRLRFAPAREGDRPVAVEVPFTWRIVPPPPSIEGVVLRRGDRKPLPGIVLDACGARATTDEAGRFRFRGLPPGTCVLALVDDGSADLPAEARPVEVRVVPGEVATVTIHAWPPLDAAAVGTYRRTGSEVVRRSLRDEEIATTPGSLGDPVRAIQNLPGLARTPLDAGWLLVRGGDPEDTGLYIDGVRVPLVYHLGGLTSVIHPAMVEQVDFLPGVPGARYGRATAGVVDLTSRRAEERRRVEVGMDLVSAGAFVETAGERVGLSGSVRRSYLDQALALWPGLGEEQAAIAPRFWDGQLRLDAGDHGLFLLGYSDAVDAPLGVDGETVVVELGTLRLHGRTRVAIGSGSLSVRPAAFRDWERVHWTEQDEENTQSLETWGTALRIQADGRRGPAVWQAGLDAEAGRTELAVDELSVERWTLSPDPYASVRLAGPVTWVLGLRLDTLLVEEDLLRWAPSPRVQARLPLSGRLEFVGDFGILHQPPPLDLLLGFPDGYRLDLERSTGGGLGARWRGGPLTLDLDGYVRALDHLAVIEDDGSLGEGRGLAFGLEGLARWRWRRLGGWVSATLSRGLREDEPGDGWRPSRYDQPVVLTSVTAWRLRRGWTLAMRLRYASGYPWDPEVETAYDILTLTEWPLDEWVDPARLRLEPFYAADFKVSRRLALRRWRLDFYLDLENANNRRIPEPVINGLEDTDPVYGFGLPVLPIFGVQGVFWPGGGARGSHDGGAGGTRPPDPLAAPR